MTKLNLEENIDSPNHRTQLNLGEGSIDQRLGGLKENISPLRSYFVDVTVSWLYWTPLMTVTECASGMESEEVIKSRLMSMAYHAVMGRPYGLVRNFWANKWDANAESSKTKKFFVDSSLMILWQVPTYTTMLYLSGASLKEGVAALVSGVAVGMLSGRLFGYVQDRWRKFFGTKPAL